MSIAPRDRAALTLVRNRHFRDTYLASLAADMQTRRVTLRIYGTLHGTLPQSDTFLGTLTFFGTTAFSIANERGTFPESVRIAALDLAYDEGEDIGNATLDGSDGWKATWAFDGIAYEEIPAIVESLADED